MPKNHPHGPKGPYKPHNHPHQNHHRRPDNHPRPGSAPLWASQNYLTGSALVRRLVALSDIGETDLVLEIGPGKGHITRELLPRCKGLIAAELDAALCQKLTARFAGEAKFTLYQGDFLQMPLPKGPYKVFANIPFSRTTAILRRLTESGRPPQAAWLVVEWGAARRFAGAGGESLASLGLKPYYDVRVAARIPRSQFHPMPRVDAALLELKRRPHPDLSPAERPSYQAFLRQALSRGPAALLTRRQISTALRQAGFPPPAPDATLQYVQWLCLFRCWHSLHPHKP